MDKELSAYCEVLEKLPTSLILVDETDTCLYVNKQGRTLFNLSKEDRTGINLSALLAPHAIQRLAAPEYEARFKTEGFDKKNAHFPIQCQSELVIINSLQYRVINFQVLTSDSQSTLNLENELGQLKQQNQQLNKFAAMASHDLQSPLRRVKSFLTLLNDNYSSSFSDEALGWIARCFTNLGEMQKLVADLHYFTQLDSISTNFSECSPTGILQGLKLEFSQSFGTNFFIDFPSTLPLINADPRLLKVFFSRLISNSISHNKKHMVSISIQICESKDTWKISVKDDGSGIEEQELHQLSEKLNKTRASGAYQGGMLGLQICMKIISMHGGNLQLKNNLSSGGTEVIASIPKTISARG